VNLAVLIHLFDPEQIQHINGDSQFFSPPDITLPNYSFYSEALSQHFVEDDDIKINLQKASDAIKNDETIIQNLGQAIILGKVDIEINFFFTTPGILLQIASILIILLILNNLYINYKLKQILLTISILQTKIVQTESLEQLILDYYKTSHPHPHNIVQPTIGPSAANPSALYILTCISAFVIILVIFAYILHKLTQYCLHLRHPIHTNFYLLFKNANESIIICLLHLPYPLENLDFTVTQQIQNIRVAHYFKPLLLFEWDLKFFNKLSHHEIPIPTHFSLSWMQSIRLRFLLSTPFTVQLMTQVHHPLQEFDFQSHLPQPTISNVPIQPTSLILQSNVDVPDKPTPTIYPKL